MPDGLSIMPDRPIMPDGHYPTLRNFNFQVSSINKKVAGTGDRTRVRQSERRRLTDVLLRLG